MPGLMAGVVCNGTGKGAFFDLLLDVVGKPLGRFADGTIVNGVTTDRIHPAASAAGAEGNYGPKGIVEFLPLAGRYVLGDLGGVFGQVGLGKPFTDIFDRGGREFSLLAGGFQLFECVFCISV